MKYLRRPSRLAAALAVLGLVSSAYAGVQAPAQATADAPSVADERAAMRANMIELSELYATFAWTATEENVLHGPCPRGIPVDSPDVSFDPDGWHPDGRVNHGMPYAWGGFSSIEEFKEGLKKGKIAGNVPASSQVPGTSHALGLDCSGFVARAWDLPTKQSTRTLGALCYELESYDELLPGDILNIVNGHVVLFKEWVDADRTRMRVVEADRLRVQENEYPRSERERRGFVPMRYKPLDDRWVPMDLQGIGFVHDGAARGRWIPDPRGDYPDLDKGWNPAAEAAPLEWVDFAVTDDFGRLPSKCRRTVMVARREGDRIDTQTIADYDGKRLMLGSSFARSATFAESIMEIAAFEEPLEEIFLVAGSVEKGDYELGGRRFSARRISAFLEGAWSMHGETRPVTAEVECVLSSEVPLHGVLEADFRIEIVWEEDEAGDITVSRRHQTFTLRGFGGLRTNR